jgi:pimeloyl-ACP methyl ester carboxylesterase
MKYWHWRNAPAALSNPWALRSTLAGVPPGVQPVKKLTPVSGTITMPLKATRKLFGAENASLSLSQFPTRTSDMLAQEPFVREAGAGPAVVCLHSNASSSAQWRGLMESASKTHRVLAPDVYGSGKSPEWPSDRTISLSDGVDLIEPVLTRAGPGLTLVGHSYGAAVALLAALRNPSRIRARMLYAPTPLAAFSALNMPILRS